AVEAYRDVLDRPDDLHFSSVMVGMNGFIARHNLSIAYMDMGDMPKAEEQLRLAVADNPGYRSAWRGLGDLLVKQGKLGDARQLADRLLADKRLHFEGILIESHLAAHQGDIESACRLLEGARKKYPNELQPLQALCRLLFERGDPARAET